MSSDTPVDSVSSPNAACSSPSGDGEPLAEHVIPAEHRRNRKLWTAEEQRAFWQRKKSEKKQRKKEAAAARQADLRVEWDELDDAEKERRRSEAVAVHESRRAAEERHHARCQANLDDPRLPALVFDLSFSWCMTVPDTKSTVSQLKFSYSALRKDAFPFRPVFSSMGGTETGDCEHSAAEQADVLAALPAFEGFGRYPPLISSQHWSELYAKEKVVFLTADAEELLEDIEDDTVYVIGAFVDHNKHKGLSNSRATAHGVRRRRLPIQESIDLGNRCKVLTINHVTSALAAYRRTRDWQAAFNEVLPTRRVQQEALGRHKRMRPDGGSSSQCGDNDAADEADKDADKETTQSA